MMLLDFIKEHEDWRQLLSEKPYCLLIKEKDGYALFKYNQIESDMSLPLVQLCRGIIVDLHCNEVACWGFDKFFNSAEPYAAQLSGKIRAEEKVDGSIIKVWLDRRGALRVATNGNIDAEDSTLAFDPSKNYRDLFNEALSKTAVNLDDLKGCLYEDLLMGDSVFTLIFELVSPQNRIVVPYSDTELYFLGARDNYSGQEFSPVDLKTNVILNQFKRPFIYDIHSIEDAVEVAKTLGADKEGFVLVDENFNRVKVKGAEYLTMHVLRNNDLSLKGFLETVLNNTQDDLLGYFPEYEPYIREIENRLSDYIKVVEEAIASAPWELDRKEFALQVKELPHSSILFKLYSNREYDWKNALISVDNLNKLAQWLDL